METTMESQKNDTVQKVEDALRISYDYCLPRFKDAHYCLTNYLNEIDTRIWGTLSECPIPMAYSNVETMIPSIMDYHFGTPHPFLLVNENGLRDEEMIKLQRYITGKVMYQMDIKRKVKPIFRDALIFPCAYAMVESTTITPPAREVIATYTMDGRMESLPEIIAGMKVKVPNIRYVDFFSVLPAPVGATPDDADWVVVIDFMDEFSIKMGLEDGTLKGSFEQMKKESLEVNSYAESALHYATYIANPDNPEMKNRLQNLNITKDSKGNYNLPMRLPVIKYYGKDEHIWICGTQVIYRKDRKDVMTSPLVRFCSQQIGDQWFPNSIVEFSLDQYNLINAWYNSVVDVMSHYLYPTTIVNKSMLMNQEQDISYQPNLIIETTGNPQQAIHYPQMPPLPPAMLEFPREIRSLLDSTSGVPEMMKGAGGVGIVRGGNNALQSLLQRSSARVMGIAEELEYSGMKPIYEKSIMMLQNIGDGDVKYLNDANELVTESVTQDEIRHVLGVQVMGKKQIENKFADQMVKIQALPLLLQSGFDPVKVVQWAFPEADVDEFIGALPPDQQAMINARNTAMAEAQGQAMGMPPEQAAQAGGAQGTGGAM
jgi:hypothetical protein